MPRIHHRAVVQPSLKESVPNQDFSVLDLPSKCPRKRRRLLKRFWGRTQKITWWATNLANLNSAWWLYCSLLSHEDLRTAKSHSSVACACLRHGLLRGYGSNIWHPLPKKEKKNYGKLGKWRQSTGDFPCFRVRIVVWGDFWAMSTLHCTKESLLPWMASMRAESNSSTSSEANGNGQTKVVEKLTPKWKLVSLLALGGWKTCHLILRWEKKDSF